MFDLREIAPGLSRDAAAGYWIAPEPIATSYPIDGNDNCLPIEAASFWFAHRNRAITAAARRYPPGDGPIFDVGAGNGYVSAALQEAGFSTVAIEPNRAGAAHAVARHVAHVVCGGLPSSAFRASTAGAIGLFDVIEHVQADGDFLRALRPFLRPDGKLYLTAPAFPRLWSGDDVRAGHFRRYTLGALRAVVAAAGYRVEYATYLFWCLPLPILLLRTLPWKVRRSSPRAPSRRAHSLGSATLRRIAGLALRFEIGRIARGRAVPFGASCLVVASVPASVPASVLPP